MYGVLIAMSLVNRLLGAFGLSAHEAFGVALSVLLMIGIGALTLLLILQRFWTNLLSGEGYLMMTLPVSTDRIILSKVFVATIWSAASTIVVTGSIMIMSVTGEAWAGTVRIFRFLYNATMTLFSLEPIHVVILAVELLVILVLSTFANILLLYSCMSLSMMVNRYRWLLAIGAYFVITTGLQIIGAVILSIGVFSDIIRGIEQFLQRTDNFAILQIIFPIGAGTLLALCAGFYFITRYMLKSRLNLQ